MITVKVHQHPVPTAQITVFVFHDNSPINNAADLPAEEGLAGFRVMLEDAGGRYGMSAGQQMMDAFGNPLGTTYGPDGNVVKMGSGVITTDADGDAMIKNLAPGKYGVQVVPPGGAGLAADLHHRGHQDHRRLGQGQRAPLLRGVRPARLPRLRRLRAGRCATLSFFTAAPPSRGRW